VALGLVQYATATTSGDDQLSITINLPSAPRANAFLVMVIANSNYAGPVFDTPIQQDVTWQQVVWEDAGALFQDQGCTLEVWAANEVNTSDQSIQVDLTGLAPMQRDICAVVMEFEGVATGNPFDVSNNGEGEDPATMDSGGVSTNDAHSLWIGGAVSGANSSIPNLGDAQNGFTTVAKVSADDDGPISLVAAYKIATATGTARMQATTDGNGYWVAAVAAFEGVPPATHEVSGTASGSASASGNLDAPGISFVQAATDSGNDSHAYPELSAAPTEGNMLICALCIGQNGVSPIFSQIGVTWYEAESIAHSGSNIYTSIWYGIVGSSASVSLDINLGTSDDYSCEVREYSGLRPSSPVDQTATIEHDEGEGATLTVGPTGATSQSDELAMVSFGINHSTRTWLDDFTDGFTESYQNDYENQVHAVGWKILDTIGTVQTSRTMDNDEDACATLATFEAAILHLIAATENKGGQLTATALLNINSVISSGISAMGGGWAELNYNHEVSGSIAAALSITEALASVNHPLDGEISAALSVSNANAERQHGAAGNILVQGTVQGDAQKIVGLWADAFIQSTVDGDAQKIVGCIGTSWCVGYLGAPLVDEPALSTAEAIGPNHIRVTFTERMEKNDALLEKTNYILTPLTPGSAYLYINEIEPQNKDYPTYVDIVVSEMTQSANYHLTVINVQDTDGKSIDNSMNQAYFIGAGGKPTVKQVIAKSDTRVDVVFTEIMKDNADLRNPSKYTFDNGLQVLGVVDVEGDTVSLVTSVQSAGEIYNLTVG